MSGDQGEALLQQGNRWAKYIFYGALLVMLSALAVYAYLGTFTRYMADDYCSAAALKNEGFWGAQVYWWENWSGRYSFSFLISLVELSGVRVVPILPAAVTALWLFSIVWVCLPLLKRLKVPHSLAASIFIACVALWMTYRSVDDYPQIVFWQTGILTYPISLILFLLGTGIAIRRSDLPGKLHWPELAGWFLFAFLAGGFSETGVVLQIALLAFLLILVGMSKIEQKQILVPILTAALCASVLSLLVIAVSPGNVARSDGFQNVPPIGQTLPGAWVQTLVFVPDVVDKHTTLFVLGFLAGVFLVYFGIPEEIKLDNISLARHFAVSLLLVGIGIWATIAPAYLLRGGIPPERVLMFAYFLVACLTIFWGALSAIFLRSNLPQTTLVFQSWISLGLLALVIAWGLFPHIVSQIELVPPLQEYSTFWDERHQSMVTASQAGEPVLQVEDVTRIESLRKLRTKLWLTGDFESDANHWINRCAAQFYGVSQIIAK